jgi:hypothetical protein
LRLCNKEEEDDGEEEAKEEEEEAMEMESWKLGTRRVKKPGI